MRRRRVTEPAATLVGAHRPVVGLGGAAMAQQDVSMLSPGEQAVDDNLDKFDSALDSLEAAARPFLQADMAAVAEQLGPIDRAKLRVALAYATTSVYFSASALGLGCGLCSGGGAGCHLWRARARDTRHWPRVPHWRHPPFSPFPWLCGVVRRSVPQNERREHDGAPC